MGFKCGIVGLPNVGKSTLFNALTQSNKAEAANYPFATIEPNIGRVAVPDDRLDKLAIIGKSEKIIPSFMDFVDIAGLVKGAPFTNPAISTKSMKDGIIFSLFPMIASLSNLSSGTATLPIFGSIVANG